MRSRLSIAAALLAVFIPVFTSAAAPTLVNYQGLLTTAAGAPVPDASYSVVFTIYDSPAGGSTIWTETQLVTTIDGTFAVLLGSVSAITDAVFSGTTRYLGMKVAADPEMAQRIALVTVPYAFRVSTVDGASGGAIHGNIDLDNSTSSTGNILKQGIPFVHSVGVDNTFIGENAGNLTVTGQSNTASGASALRNNLDGTRNTAHGHQALLANLSGSENTADGERALATNSIGGQNTATGFVSLYSNLSGSGNTAAGTAALWNNSTGNYNTAVGYDALFNNTVSGNTAIGHEALYNNGTGDGNMAAGKSALFFNTTGWMNTATGMRALYGNNTGGWNTAVGYEALLSNGSSIRNTGVGVGALYSNSGPGNNTAVGYWALFSNNSGVENTALGVQALGGNTTGSYNTACGSYAGGGTGNNNTALGYNALHVNVGDRNTACGNAALYSNAGGGSNTASGLSALQGNTIGNNNVASGESALGNNSSGSQNTAIGNFAFDNNTTGSYNTAIGYAANCSPGSILTNATAIGSGAVVNASNKIRLGNGSVSLIEAQVGITVVSDRNQKENFRPVDGDGVLRKIREMSLTSWNFKGHNPMQFRHYGPMAQDFYVAFGHDGFGQCGDSTTINSTDMSGILMIAVQALARRTAEMETIKAENAELKASMTALQAEMASFRQEVSGTQVLGALNEDGSRPATELTVAKVEGR